MQKRTFSSQAVTTFQRTRSIHPSNGRRSRPSRPFFPIHSASEEEEPLYKKNFFCSSAPNQFDWKKANYVLAIL